MSLEHQSTLLTQLFFGYIQTSIAPNLGQKISNGFSFIVGIYLAVIVTCIFGFSLIIFLVRDNRRDDDYDLELQLRRRQ